MPRERSITFTSEGEQVVGMLHLPDGKGPFPAVVFLHGFTGNKGEAHRIFVQAARGLAAAGIVSLRFDFRGSGDSAGEFSQMTIAGELADARAALRYLGRRREVDTSRIGVLGMSMGGLVAVLLLADQPRVRAAVLWNPVAHPRALCEARASDASRQQLAAMGVADWQGWAVGVRFIEEMMTLDPLGASERVRVPVLIIQAAEDQTVPRGWADDYVAAFARSGCRAALHVVDGADHTFSSLGWTMEVMAATLPWFGCHLLGPRGD